MEPCDLCAELHEVQTDGPFYREFRLRDGSKTYKRLCLFHEHARRRLVLFRQRESRSLDRDAMLEVDPTTGHTCAFALQ